MHFLFTNRRIRSGKLTAKIDPETSYLTLRHEGRNRFDKWTRDRWLELLRPNIGRHGVAIFVHGFNTTVSRTLWGLRKLKKGLQDNGFRGEVIAYAWPNPTGGGPLKKYVETRESLPDFAGLLYDNAAKPILRLPGRPKVHLVCHSMGGRVLRQGLNNKTGPNFETIAMFAADLERKYFGAGGKTDELFAAWSARTVSYYNAEDWPLGKAVHTGWPGPRVGKVGLPHPTPDGFTDVDCTERYRAFMASNAPKPDSSPSHRFYFMDPHFLRDLSLTLQARPSTLREDPPAPPDHTLRP